ncbi:MAG: ubiquinol oxidase subunit II [Rhizobiales bacterium 17-65-6]|nr:MAG: ubiquinol oxidase subunit II [Azorhizobium sp. 32-67-21]OZA00290.1 MAG: ubiquinol oxidase subunit II [Rhizobiales bacterium 17-65-6]
MSRLRLILLLPLAALLAGCNFVVLDPSGDIAIQQRDIVVISTALMLLIIIPVLALTVWFAWKYRATNTSATYDPDWHHSTQLELVIWAAPLLIIICLGALTWMGTHLLDPYRPLDRIAAGTVVKQDEHKPLEVEVVALDWKWLFIYPEQGMATVNELVAPVNRPISFKITASSVMNSFYIPALAGMIYAMPGMETKLHAVINEAGVYRGISANYSGAGFSGMHFRFHGVSDADFEAWVAKAKAGGGNLTRAAYLDLEKPSENVPVTYFAQVDPVLFRAIVNMCVETGKMCMSEMMAIDEQGGLGLEGVNNVLALTYDKYARRGTVLGGDSGFVVGICSPEDLVEAGAKIPAIRTTPATRLMGAGLPVPAFTPISAPSSPFTAPFRPSSI